jgi:hypothetical protein
MTTNPFLNALGALAYVISVVSFIHFATGFAETGPDESVLVPIGMLSLLSLSAAVMAYIFFYQPILMLFDGKRKEAVQLFLQTIATFAALTFCVLLAAMLFFE